MKNKILNICGMSFILLLLMVGSISAFAVSSRYSDQNPLDMMPGETKVISVDLQNMDGPEELFLQGEISSDGDIAKFVNPLDRYSVSRGSRDTYEIEITIPEEEYQSTYNILTTFSTVEDSESGTFSFGNSIQKKISVNVLEEPSFLEKVNPTYLIAVIVLAVILIGFAAYKKSKK